MKRLLSFIMIFMVMGCTPKTVEQQPKTCPAGYAMIAGDCVERV